MSTEKQAKITAESAVPAMAARQTAPEAHVDFPASCLRYAHQAMGNCSVGRWVQAKLKTGSPDDAYEQEADRVADHVMRMPDPAVQRKCTACESGGAGCAECGKEEEHVQRMPAATKHLPSSAARPLATGGTALPKTSRDYFEPRMGYDFSSVRLHDGTEAARSAQSLAARAYTYGNNIVFAAGEYNPGTPNGNRLLAHELTHVVQQGRALASDQSLIQRMPACPARLGDNDPVLSGWQDYHGNTSWFHCGFRVILENRNPTPADPQQECAYDHSGTLVDENHPYAGCRGTPNQYDSAQHPLDHTFSDTGGIWQAGGPAFMTSRVYTLAQPIATAIQIVATAGQVIHSVAQGFQRVIAVAVLTAAAMVDPGNWRFQGLPARSRQHLNVMGALLGSAALSQNADTLLRNLTRRLDSFAIAGLLDDLAADINQALQATGGTAQPITASTLGELSLLQLVEWLRVQGLLQYVRPPEDIANEQYDAQATATPTPSP